MTKAETALCGLGATLAGGIILNFIPPQYEWLSWIVLVVGIGLMVFPWVKPIWPLFLKKDDTYAFNLMDEQGNIEREIQELERLNSAFPSEIESRKHQLTKLKRQLIKVNKKLDKIH